LTTLVRDVWSESARAPNRVLCMLTFLVNGRRRAVTANEKSQDIDRGQWTQISETKSMTHVASWLPLGKEQRLLRHGETMLEGCR